MTLPLPASLVQDEPAFQHGSRLRVGVLLVNLGTPDAADGPALRRYLKEFLSDPRVVEIPKLVWWPILNLIILNTRPKKSAAKYASVWLDEGSPLRVYSERQAEGLRHRLKAEGYDVEVELAMRYGNPSIGNAMKALQARKVNRLLVLPLYPQYSASTTATVFDKVYENLAAMRSPPALRTIRHYHDHPGYIQAVANRIRAHWDAHGRGDLSCLVFMVCPSAACSRAIRTTANATRQADWWPRPWAWPATNGGSHFSLALAEQSGSSPIPRRCWSTCRKKASSGSMWPALASSQTVLRPWKRLRWKARRSSWMLAARNTVTSPA